MKKILKDLLYFNFLLINLVGTFTSISLFNNNNKSQNKIKEQEHLYLQANNLGLWSDTRSNNTYNLTLLTKNENQPWKVIDSEQRVLYNKTDYLIYYFNFGTNHYKACHNQYALATEVFIRDYIETDICVILGRMSSKTTIDVISSSNPSNGVYISYGNGDNCDNSMDYEKFNTPRSVEFKIYCNKNYLNELQEQFYLDYTNKSQGTTKCKLSFRINSVIGCPLNK